MQIYLKGGSEIQLILKSFQTRVLSALIKNTEKQNKRKTSFSTPVTCLSIVPCKNSTWKEF